MNRRDNCASKIHSRTVQITLQMKQSEVEITKQIPQQKLSMRMFSKEGSFLHRVNFMQAGFKRLHYDEN